MRSAYLTAVEAAETLGISIPSLYAYVSRGLIRSEGTGARRQGRQYLREDVERLKTRKEGRRDPAQAAEGTLDWGLPVLESAITLIDRGRLYYRGQDALALSASHSVEEVAALIWTGDLAAALPGIGDAARPPSLWSSIGSGMADLDPVDRFRVALTLAGAEEPSAYDLRPQATLRTAVRIVRLLTAVAAGDTAADDRREMGIAASLAAGWGLADPGAERLLSSALILCADHELNVSSFTARCVASAGSPLHAAVAAGIGALQGVKHGGQTARVEAFFREAETASGARRAVAGYLKRGESLPGFDHPLYPEGDPRGKALLNLTRELLPGSPKTELVSAICEEALEVTEQHPTIDLALVAMTSALGLPRGSALTLFALGRTIGWIGHAREQYALDRLIRPRARYTGPSPDD